jgi:hypothetical protein
MLHFPTHRARRPHVEVGKIGTALFHVTSPANELAKQRTKLQRIKEFLPSHEHFFLSISVFRE